MVQSANVVQMVKHYELIGDEEQRTWCPIAYLPMKHLLLKIAMPWNNATQNAKALAHAGEEEGYRKETTEYNARKCCEISRQQSRYLWSTFRSRAIAGIRHSLVVDVVTHSSGAINPVYERCQPKGHQRVNLFRV